MTDIAERISEFGTSTGVQFVLVDNGSNDGSFNSLQTHSLPNINVVKLTENMGYGGGILAGVQACRTEFVGWMHADLQTPPDVLRNFLPLVRPGVLLKGRRFGRPVSDFFFTFAMAAFESTLFCSKLSDINGQPTVFPREWFMTLPNPPTDFGLDLFVFVEARRASLEVLRIRVPFLPRQRGLSSWNSGLKSKIRFARRTISFSLKLRAISGD